MICSNKFFLILFSLLAGLQLFAAPPIPFSGKLAVDGTNFHGNALFSFSIVDGEGKVHWKHANEPDSKIENFVMNGRYLVLLGGQGMQTLPADLFLQHESLFLRVSVDLKDGKGMRLLEPDQRITSSPYALSAEIARLAERAQVAGGVDTGAITADMLEQALLADLNRTFELGLISRDMLHQAVRDDLNRTITRDRLSTDVRADLNRTIGITNLSSEVTDKLNREFTIEPGSIGKGLLAQDVRDDLNRTITRDRLSQDLIADLNRTVRLQDLSEEVSQSINRPITREMLPQGVRDELNATITRERLSADVRADLNRTIGITNLSSEVTEKLNREFTIEPGSIGKALLAQDVRDDLNRTITRDRLSGDIIADLNRTVRLQDLSDEVSQSINRPITREMLPQGVRDELNATITLDRLSAEVRADLNRTIGITNLSSEVTEKLNREFTIEPGSIGKSLLAQDVREDLNRTITRDRLSQDLIADLNRTVRLQDLSEEVSQSINRPITREMLPQGVRDELNATITRDRLSADVRADLNRTIGIANLSSEVTDILNQTFSIDAGSITLDQLSQQVRDDINRTITRDRLSSDVLSDINRTITKSMLSQEVLDELNATGGATGSVPGSLIAVPANQSTPSGYELYQKGEPKELVWEEKASFSEARGFLGAMLQESPDNLIYAIGGHVNPSTSFNKVEAYNPISDSWSVKANLSETSFGQTTTTFDGKIYVMGGYELSKVEIYDPGSNQWSLGTQIPIATRYASSVSLNSKMFIFGGRQSSSTIVNQVYSFDSVQNSWTEKAHLQTPRAGHRSVVFNGKIWVIGGSNLTDVFKSVEIYDHVNDAWSYGPDLKINRQGFSCWTWGNKLFLAGGFNETGILDSIEVYDTDSGSWKLYGTLPTPNKYAMATVLHDKIYLYGGEINDAVYSNKLYAADLNASMEGVHDLYVKTGDASTGTPTVQAEVADGSIGPSKLSSEVSNALKPVVVGQPSSVVEVGGNPAYLAVDVDGVNLSYQWKKNGVEITGATGRTLSISDLNASQHEGNYTVVVSNAFGSVTSSVAQIDVNGSLTEGLVGWWKFDETEGNIAYDSSGNERDGNFSAGGNWVNGKIGGALDLNGSTSVQILNYKGVLGTTARSISMWLKSGSQNGGGLFSWGGSNSEGHVHYYALGISTSGGLHNSDYGSLKLAISAGFFVGTQKVNTNEWFHVVVVSEENSNVVNSKLFLNLSEDTALKTLSKMINTVSDRDVTLGGDLDGLLDDIRIYDRALSALEVKALYELGEQQVQESGSGTTTVVNGTVADGSIGLSKLSSEVSNALKPVVVGQPSSVVGVRGTSAYLTVVATGGDNTYQWKKNGADIAGATSSTISIADLNASQHEGNYTVVVSNAFGSATSSVAQIDVNGSLTEGLVGWWKFDETSGNIASDSSGNGNDGNLTNGPTWTEGKIGGALSFDGVDDFVNFGVRDVFNLESEISVSLWIKASDYKYAQVISKSTLSGTFTWAFKWRVSTERFYFRIYDPSGQYETFLRYNQNPPLNEWSNILFSYGDSNSKLYLNSNLEAEGDFTATLTNQTNPLLLGGAGSEMFFGLIDDVRIYDRALSAFEVKALYELGEQPVQESGAGTTTVVNGTVADGSITTNQLSEQILKYLKPEITQQPTATNIFADTNGTISVSAEGKYLTYQWKKNGVNLTGETNATLTITDANATQHDGNYSVVVSNDFGSVESNVALTDIWMVGENIANLVLWLDASREDSFVLNNSIIQNWKDLSGQGNDMNITDGNASLTGILNGRSVAYYDGNDITATTKNFSSELDQSGYSIVALSRYAGDPKYRVISSGYGPGSRNWLFGHHGGKHSTFFAETWIDTGITGDLNWHMFTVTHEPAISYNNGSDPLSSFWLDGTNRILNSGLSSDTSPAPADIVFGGALNQEKSPCEVAEFIMVGAEISDGDRQKLEGYIAHKWGLSAILPSTHPYKN